MFNNYEDFYALFEQHKDDFAASDTYEAFCQRVGKEWLKNYKWAVRVFNTAKAGKRTYHPLTFPTIERFADLFTSAEFIPTDAPATEKRGLHFLSGNAGLAMHVGGTRAWSKTSPDTRSHYGAKFYGTYVQPVPAVMEAVNAWGGHLDAPRSYSFEAIEREDGILVLAHDSLYIGSTWLALLPLTEDIETLFDAETRELVARERAAEMAAWGGAQ